MFTERDEFSGTITLAQRDMAEEWFVERVDDERLLENPTLAKHFAEHETYDVDVTHEEARDRNRPIQADRVWIDGLLDEVLQRGRRRGDARPRGSPRPGRSRSRSTTSSSPGTRRTNSTRSRRRSNTETTSRISVCARSVNCCSSARRGPGRPRRRRRWPGHGPPLRRGQTLDDHLAVSRRTAKTSTRPSRSPNGSRRVSSSSTSSTSSPKPAAATNTRCAQARGQHAPQEHR